MSTLSELNGWIASMKASGHWVTRCLSCGWFFAQLHKGRRGRRAVVCGKHRCCLWRGFQNRNGRAPPAWMLAKWREEHGDKPRTDKPKRFREEMREAAS